MRKCVTSSLPVAQSLGHWNWPSFLEVLTCKAVARPPHPLRSWLWMPHALLPRTEIDRGLWWQDCGPFATGTSHFLVASITHKKTKQLFERWFLFIFVFKVWFSDSKLWKSVGQTFQKNSIGKGRRLTGWKGWQLEQKIRYFRELKSVYNIQFKFKTKHQKHLNFLTPVKWIEPQECRWVCSYLCSDPRQFNGALASFADGCSGAPMYVNHT